MNFAGFTDSSRYRYLLAVSAGLALAMAFPGFNIAGLAWIAPGLLIAAASGTKGWHSFRIGYCGGLAFQLATLHWLLHIPVTGFPILGWVALSAFLASYQGAWVWLVNRLPFGETVLGHQSWALGGAAAWVGIEMVQARFLSGFPWHLLGVSQVQMTPLIQIAAVTGVYGVSFVVVWAALSLVAGVRVLLARPTARYAWLGEIILPLSVVLGLCSLGMSRLRDSDDSNQPTLRVAFIQPSIPQTMIWNTADNARRFSELMQLTERSLTNRPQLILWPEAALPTMLRYDELAAKTITDFARSNRVWLILGSDDAEPARRPEKPDDADYFNASFLIDPQGHVAGRYLKRNLVIFGEYIPLARWLPFVKWFTPIDGGFTAGDRVETFTLSRRTSTNQQELVQTNPEPAESASPIHTATLICFEDVFPHHVREYVQPETDFLINLTNDGWFGEGAEQWQHAYAAVFRAIENGVPLLRACNNGLTCWIDARGRIRQIFRDPQNRIYGAGVMVAEIPRQAVGRRNEQTFYNRHGDWFGWSCVVWTAVAAALHRRPQQLAP